MCSLLQNQQKPKRSSEALYSTERNRKNLRNSRTNPIQDGNLHEMIMQPVVGLILVKL